MTLVDIESPQQVRRDQWGRYKILPPDGGKPTGYQRATTLAKMLEDTSNLTAWACRMTLLGAAQRPDIIASVQTTDPDDRKALNALVERAKEIGGANVRRELGTALHKMVELSHADADYTVPEAYAADVAAINRAIDVAGFDVVTEFSERILVCDSIRVAGMCDLVLRRRSDGRLFIGDLKTGSSVKYGALGWATQLSIYSMADAIYEQGLADDGTEDRRVPMPEVDRSQAFIIHCEPQSGSAQIHRLAIGAEFVDLAVAVREIRKRRDLLVKFEGGGTDTQAGVDPVARTAEVVGSVEDNQPPAAALAILHETRTAWLINRAAHLVTTLSKRHVAEAWPVDVATPKAITEGATWSAFDIDAIVAALDALEAKHDVPFGDEDPANTAARQTESEARADADVVPPRPEPVVLDDGGIADDADVQRLLDNVKAMAQSPDAAVRERVQRVALWQRQADSTDHPWRSRQGVDGTTPMRVYVVLLAAVALIDHIDVNAADPDHKVRTLLTAVIGDDAAKPNNSTGQILGALTVDQAIELGDLAG